MRTNKSLNQRTLKTLESISKMPLTLGSLLWSIRKGEELTQATFALKLGISKQYLSDIECERRFISVHAAVEYAEKLGYSPKHFVRLCLQDIVNKEGLEWQVELKKAA